MLGDTLGVSSIPHLQEHVLDVDGRRLRKMRGWLAEAVPKRDRPLVAMAPVGEDGLATEWQPERYAALMDLLAWRHCAQTVLICPSSMTSRCRQVAAMSRCGPIIAEQDSLGDQMALLSLCDGFVGNDSGITMLAAALGIPTIAIFGSTGPAKTAPIGAAATFVYHQIECSPCGARACPYGSYNCLRWVTPYEIDDALSKLGAFDSTVRSPSSAGSGPREMRKYRSPFQDNLRPR